MSQVTTQIYRTPSRPVEIQPRSSLELKLVTEFPGTVLSDGVSHIGTRSVGIISRYPPAPIDHTSTLYYTWYKAATDGLLAGTYGEFYKGVLSTNTSRISIGSKSSFIVGIQLVSSGRSRLSVESRGDIWLDAVKKNWVKWSNIGSADFTIWKDNIAGERPLEWNGWVQVVKKLGNKIIVYGANGVSSLIPIGNTYGLQSIYRIGVKGKGAVAGDSSIHFFVDRSGQLFSLGELTRKSSLFEEAMYPEKLDYSEYLSNMGDIVLTWDSLNSLLYICDGITGYVYNPSSKSFGEGPKNITGMSHQDDKTYVVSTESLNTPLFEICTGLFDLGSRKPKNIRQVEVGVNASTNLKGAIEYRLAKNEPLHSTPWVPVTPSGVFYLPCYGLEFRFKLRATSLEDFKLDYMRVFGNIHGFSYLDGFDRQG